MTRLFVIVEGPTEERFTSKVLAPHLAGFGFASTSARIVGNARRRRFRGGIVPWPTAKAEILLHLRSDRQVVITTMVDYYGLPLTGDGAWPSVRVSPQDSIPEAVEEGMRQDIASGMGDSFNLNRFVPFIVMHEFEGLLFSDCSAFAEAIGHASLRQHLQSIRDGFRNPEEINDGPSTHPSKRITDLWAGYQKPAHGTFAAEKIGVPGIERECPHFAAWLARLARSCEALG